MLDKAYHPQENEDRIYGVWEGSGAFRADASSTREPFVITMPPPNATGQLHLGHAVMLAIEDILVRFARMNGKEALWVPGTDHAAIATESVVIKKIQKEEGMPDPRAKLGREEILRRIQHFVSQSQSTIRGQVKKMGSSCDWSRERYTMDPICNRLVNEVFVSMYRDGLIYRGHRIVNWDPKMQTTVSDDEMEHKEETAPFYTFQYGPFQIGTVRPETKFGDKYVVMHPDDERYAHYKHGDTFTCEWINGPIEATIIKDKAVDPAFGTGVMTITPWHTAIDFEIAERHGLDKEQVIGFDGKLLDIAGEFAGMRIEDARPKIVEKLAAKGLVVETKTDYVHNVAVSYRGGVIEPQIREQWFIDVNKPVVHWKRRQMSLKDILREVVETHQVRIIPDRFEKVYLSWIENLRDWCISRQIWWGHRIPVWTRDQGGAIETHVGVTAPTGDGWQQDPDTLDTWFSSALWTWSTLVDADLADKTDLSLPELLLQSPDFRKFHPTHVMETGYDLLFFWVARMILMTTYATGNIAELEYGQVPFETVYFHGLVRTRDGQKMSKSKPETAIDPLDIIPKYGADALRLSMVVGQSPGADSRLYEEKIAGQRNFINKLWNASRFVLLTCEKEGLDPHAPWHGTPRSLADQWLAHGLSELVRSTTASLEAYRLSEAADTLYAFTWNEFCDWYLELSKGEPNAPLLLDSLRVLLTLLHPFCPFVTERLWEEVKPADAGLLLKSEWPTNCTSTFAAEHAKLQRVIDVISAIRRLRTTQNLEPGKLITVTLVTDGYAEILEAQREHIMRLAKVGTLTIATSKPAGEITSEFLAGIEVHLSLEGLVDKEKERATLTREKEDLERRIGSTRTKLDDAAFTAKAPEKVIAFERQKLQENEEKLGKVLERLAGM
jgi:valyl-tRNA synthetase